MLRLSRRLRQEAAGEITPSQLAALSTVSRLGELSLGELANVERIAPPTMTRIVARLEERGWLQRNVDSSDRRVTRVAVSDSGRALLDETRTRRDAYLAARIRKLSAEERAVLDRAVPLLERLAADDGEPSAGA